MNRDNRGKREPRDNRGRRDYRPARNDNRNRENRETRIPEEEKTPSADRLEGRNSVLEALKACRTAADNLAHNVSSQLTLEVLLLSIKEALA